MGQCCSFYASKKNKKTTSRHSTITNHELNRNLSQIKDFSSINLSSKDYDFESNYELNSENHKKSLRESLSRM